MSAWTENEKKILLGIARDSIEDGIRSGTRSALCGGDFSESLQATRSTFVTLKIRETLRGCIGSVYAHRPLVEDVSENAYASAFGDPRFPPVRSDEMSRLRISISVLSPFTEICCANRSELIQRLRPGIDGLLIEQNQRRATFLPSVWEILENSERFVSQLMLKAGFREDHWSPSLRTMIYSADHLEDPESIH